MPKQQKLYFPKKNKQPNYEMQMKNTNNLEQDYTPNQQAREKLIEEAKKQQRSDRSEDFTYGSKDQKDKEKSRLSTSRQDVYNKIMANPKVIVNTRHPVNNAGRDLSSVRNTLIYQYANANTLTHKMAELRNRINNAQETQNMILITDVKPKLQDTLPLRQNQTQQGMSYTPHN